MKYKISVLAVFSIMLISACGGLSEREIEATMEARIEATVEARPVATREAKVVATREAMAVATVEARTRIEATREATVAPRKKMNRIGAIRAVYDMVKKQCYPSGTFHIGDNPTDEELLLDYDAKYLAAKGKWEVIRHGGYLIGEREFIKGIWEVKDGKDTIMVDWIQVTSRSSGC